MSDNKIVTITHDRDAPIWEGPMTPGEVGRVIFPDGHADAWMTYPDYMQYMRDHFPNVISERDPCPHCGR